METIHSNSSSNTSANGNPLKYHVEFFCDICGLRFFSYQDLAEHVCFKGVQVD